MYSNILNNWFYGEDVQVDDMKLLTKSFLQLCFAANGGNVMATGITPTITGNNIATTKGFVYFGETSDAIFIERTGTNQLLSFVDPTSVPLIANGYLYVKPIITYDVNNRTSTVSGVVYTSTNAADEGINLATITNSVITQVNSINPLGATQLQRGITQLATQAEVNAGTVTNKSVSPSTLQAKITANGVGIIASGSNANGSWIKYASGLIQQWGTLNMGAYITPNIYMQVGRVFPLAFTSAGTVIVSSTIRGGLQANSFVNISSENIDASGFQQFYSSGAASAVWGVMISWTAIGY